MKIDGLNSIFCKGPIYKNPQLKTTLVGVCPGYYLGCAFILTLLIGERLELLLLLLLFLYWAYQRASLLSIVLMSSASHSERFHTL